MGSQVARHCGRALTTMGVLNSSSRDWLVAYPASSWENFRFLLECGGGGGGLSRWRLVGLPTELSEAGVGIPDDFGRDASELRLMGSKDIDALGRRRRGSGLRVGQT